MIGGYYTSSVEILRLRVTGNGVLGVSEYPHHVHIKLKTSACNESVRSKFSPFELTEVHRYHLGFFTLGHFCCHAAKQ